MHTIHHIAAVVQFALRELWADVSSSYRRVFALQLAKSTENARMDQTDRLIDRYSVGVGSGDGRDHTDLSARSCLKMLDVERFHSQQHVLGLSAGMGEVWKDRHRQRGPQRACSQRCAHGAGTVARGLGTLVVSGSALGLRLLFGG